MTDTIIFDLDGTLLDTLEDLTDSLNFALDKLGLPIRTIEEVRQFVGRGAAKLIERSVEGGISHPQYEAILNTFREQYAEHCEDKTRPYEGILELLKEVKEQGYKMAIVSNKFDAAVKRLKDKYFEEYIDVAIGESATVKRKPAPDTVYQALAELSSDAEHSVYVGDSEVDRQTAANVPMRCISVTWGFRTSKQLLDDGAAPDRIIRNPRELLPLVASLDSEA